MTPLETSEFIADEMSNVFPIGDIKVPKGDQKIF